MSIYYQSIISEPALREVCHTIMSGMYYRSQVSADTVDNQISLIFTPMNINLKIL
jgi:hypothetical protein